MREMMGNNKILFTIFICLFLIGCGNGTATEQPNDSTIEVKNISANKLIDQEPSNEVKKILKKHDEILGIKAANTSKNIIVAVKVKHNKRFQLKKIKKDLTKELKKNLKNFHIELTTDKKIYLELDKLEDRIQTKSIKPTKLGKEIDRITKLSKDNA